MHFLVWCDLRAGCVLNNVSAQPLMKVTSAMAAFTIRELDHGAVCVVPSAQCLAQSESTACFGRVSDCLGDGNDLLLDLGQATVELADALVEPLTSLAAVAASKKSFFALVVPDKDARKSLYPVRIGAGAVIYDSMPNALLALGFSHSSESGDDDDPSSDPNSPNRPVRWV